MVVTEEVFRRAAPHHPSPGRWADAMRMILPEYEINTQRRIAAFLAQCGHESAGFTVTEENLNYSAEALMRTFPRYFPTLTHAKPYARNPEKIANHVYACRMGNGSEESGDGWRYRGRGCIQLTGKDNYKAFAAAVNLSLDAAVQYLGTINGAVESACWFWKTRGLNAMADAKDMVTMTKKVNGGLHGLEDRQRRYSNLLLTV